MVRNITALIEIDCMERVCIVLHLVMEMTTYLHQILSRALFLKVLFTGGVYQASTA